MNSDLVIISVPYKPFVSIIQKGCTLPNVKFLIFEAKTGFFWKTLFRVFLVLRLYSLALMCKMPKKEYRQFRFYAKNSSTRFLFWSPFFLTWWYSMGKFLRKNQKSCFCWGPINNAANVQRLGRFVEKAKRDGFSFFTMNPDDAEKYGMRLTSQVYRHFDFAEDKVEADFYFLGKTKGRENVLNKIKSVLVGKGFLVNFHLFEDVPKEPVSFEENVRLAKKSRCLVDIVAPKYGQDGMTLRPLEALFLKKKLVTNFKKIKAYDFYYPDNIFVVDEKELNFDGIEEFMEKPLYRIDENIIEKYEVNHWLKRYFLSTKNDG